LHNMKGGSASITILKNSVQAAGTILGKLLLTAVFVVVITVILSILAAVITLTMNMQYVEKPDLLLKDPFFARAATWAQLFGFIGAVWIMYRLFERRGKSLSAIDLGLRRRTLLRGSLTGFLLGGILITLVCVIIWLLQALVIVHVEWNQVVQIELLMGLVLFIGVAVSEELTTRGYIQGLIKAKFPTAVAIAVTSIIFALMHSMNPGIWSSPVPLLNLLLAGALFGVAREASGSLWMPIGMHVSWNWLQGNVYGFYVSGTPTESVIRTKAVGSDYVSGGAFGAEGSIVTSVILIIGIWLIYMFHHKKSKISGRYKHESI
jgi:membrane protease YdiL (CAAX protease family)